jgi:glyoxylase-like metal-dependent hydrolase (beta-lactamase superfamily II)
VAHHYEGDDLIVRKIEIGEMENNTYVLEDPETHQALLIDGCFEADKIIAGAEGAEIVGIVQTHGHFDHVQALAELKDHYGVPVYSHPAEEYPVPIDKELGDGDTIPFGTREAKVIFTPGHTPGGVCLLVGKHLVSGDTLFPGGPGNTWEDEKKFDQIIENIETKLFTLPDETAVYPGHGKDTTLGAERPAVPEWRARGW